MPEPSGVPLALDPPGYASPATTDVPAGPLRNRALRNVAASLLFGISALALAWFFTQGAGAGADSRPVTVTASASGSAPRIGQPAPEFTVASLDGTPIQLSALRGHPVWVNFWASWCPPCRAESPEIEAAYQAYRGQGLVIIGVNVGEDAATVRNYVSRAGLTYPIGGDPATDVAAAYRVAGLPTHVFIDAEGVVRDIRVGRVTGDIVRQEMSALLGPNVAK